MRGVFERPKASGIWWISYFDASGNWHREKVGRYSVAVEAYVNRKREIREGRYVPPSSRKPRMSFSDLFDHAIEAKRGRNSPYSVHKDLIRKETVVGGLGDKLAAAIAPADIETFLGTLRAGGTSGPTANRYRALISSVFSYGVRIGTVESNPVARVPRYKENAGRIRYLLEGEETKLREVIRAECPRREAEFDLAICTGMRRGEQFTIRWENVNTRWKTLTVTGKQGRRNIRLNPIAIAAVEILRKRSRGSVFVCPETKADGQADWRRWFEECCKKAGIENFHWHDLRHTFASRLAMAGVDLRTIQELLGHKTLAMTLRYAHLSQTHTQAAVDKLPTYQPEAKRGRPRKVIVLP